MAVNQEKNARACVGIKHGGVCLGEHVRRKELREFDDSKSDEGCKDIADLLPGDPFGMDFNICLPIDPFGTAFDIEATVVSFADWRGNFGIKSRGFESDESSVNKHIDDDSFVAELNFVWTSPTKSEEEKNPEPGSNMKNVSGGDMELMCFGCEKYHSECVKNYRDADDGAPVDALFFALGYLGVKDLLSVERVCKSLRDAVQNDPLLWRNIHIDNPLSNKITDDNLLQLTNRAQGTLCSLGLVKSFKITNVGLMRVLESNSRLTKLSVPGCIRLKVEGILHDLKAFNSVALPGIKYLRIGEIFGMTNQHFKEFKLLLGADEDRMSTNYKPRFYQAGQMYLSLDDERAIDIEICPICEQARQVYDCPAESCQVKTHSMKTCRACIFCVARCMSCGCCLTDKSYEETLSFDLLCIDCLARLFHCKDSVTLSPTQACIHQKASYHFVLYS